MFDFVQIVVILVIVVSAFVGVEVLLQLRFHGTILSLGILHVVIFHGIGRTAKSGNATLYHDGAGRYNAEQKRHDKKSGKSNQSSFPMLCKELCRLLRILGGFLCRFRRFLRCLCGVLSGFACFRRHIFLFDGSLLLPSGIGVTGKLRIVTLGLLIQGFEIGFICRCFCVSCVAIGFELVRAMCGVNHPHTTLGNFLYPVSTFYADVILLGLSDFSVSRSQSGIDRCRLDYYISILPKMV